MLEPMWSFNVGQPHSACRRIQHRQIRIPQVCLRLEEVHPPLEELATSAFQLAQAPVAAGESHRASRPPEPRKLIHTHFETVSESPMTARKRLGRVIATVDTCAISNKEYLYNCELYDLYDRRGSTAPRRTVETTLFS